MQEHDVLDPASAAEAEMAAVAHQCLVSALDHSKADLIRVTLNVEDGDAGKACLLYTSPSPRDQRGSRMPSSA